MGLTGKQEKESTHLRRKLVATIIALLVAVAMVGTATYAWYIYNASRHITDVKMAAGTGVTFLISDKYDGPFKTSAGMSFEGLLSPVSTDQIRVANGKGGFQTVVGYTDDEESGTILANLFAPASYSDYYVSTLYLTSNATDETDVYLADIGFADQDSKYPISTALRVGLVVHDPGENQAEVSECIFQLTDKQNPDREYNTYNGQEGCVLDSSKTDGSVVEFSPLTSDNYANYDEDTGEITLKSGSKLICTLPAAEEGAEHGTPVQVDVYIWLEGCDPDCTGAIGTRSLDSLALQFVGVR